MNTDIIYFHGHKKRAKLQNPSLIKPFYITDNFKLAKDYTSDSKPVVYALTLKNDAKIFDFRKGTDIPKLKGKSIYSDETLDIMAHLYKENDPIFTFWEVTHHGMYEAKMIFDYVISYLDKNAYFPIEFLKNDINHKWVRDASIIQNSTKETALEVQNFIKRKTGKNSIFEYVSSGKVLDDVADLNEVSMNLRIRLQVYAMADMLDSIANGTYPFDFLSYRRPLYKAILEMGYEVVQDNETDMSGKTEFAILSENAVDKILNIPICDSDQRVAGLDRKLLDISFTRKPISITDFQKLLTACNAKARKAKF